MSKCNTLLSTILLNVFNTKKISNVRFNCKYFQKPIIKSNNLSNLKKNSQTTKDLVENSNI